MGAFILDELGHASGVWKTDGGISDLSPTILRKEDWLKQTIMGKRTNR
jgi:hypothetical protein